MLKYLGEILPHACHAFGDQVAVVTVPPVGAGEPTRSFTFRDLETLSSRFASRLVGLGVEPGDRITLYSANRWEWIVAYHGIVKSGAVVNPINVMLTPSEVEFVAQDCGVKIIVASPEKGAPLLGIEARTSVEHIVLFGPDVEDALSFDELLETGDPHFAPVPRGPSDRSTIGYTSGTTGHPKGAVVSQRAVVFNAAMTAQLHLRSAADTVVHALPLAHVYGNVIMNSVLMYGMKMVVHATFDAEAILGSIQEHRATIFDGVPTMYMYMLDHPELERFDLSSLTRCFVGGQTMPKAKMEAVEARFGCPLFELWGMTELGGLGTTVPSLGPNRHGSIGLPLPYLQAKIVDPEDAARTLGPGEPGELMIKGPAVMEGYWGNEEATRATIEPDGWLHTGDIAEVDEDGYYFVVDRKKDMILTGGYNIYPAEIERVVAGHPAVAMVAVGKVPDETKGELAKAYVVLGQGKTATEAEILAFCRQHLAAYKVPRLVAFVDDLPKTSTGKVMRRELSKL